MSPHRILRQRKWTEAQLRAAGYRHFQRRKALVMARVLSPEEAPLTIRVGDFEDVTVEAGYYILFDPGDDVRPSLYAYPHWPSRADMFIGAYSPWQEPGWQPTPPQAHLVSLGCAPYYKHQGVWARQTKRATWVQSIESPVPAYVPKGHWVLIGIGGEPYHTTDNSFRARYIVEPSQA